MKRAIAQMMVVPWVDDELTPRQSLLVVATDGTLWDLKPGMGGAVWTEVNGIPQADAGEERLRAELEEAKRRELVLMEELQPLRNQVSQWSETGPWVPLTEHREQIAELEERMRNLVKINQALEARLAAQESAPKARKKAGAAR